MWRTPLGCELARGDPPMIANEIANKEHRTMISQFSPSMISKTHNTILQMSHPSKALKL
jgi:hypothetical protein